MNEILKINAEVVSDYIIEYQSPFVCSFQVLYKNDVFTAILTGSKAKELYKDIKPETSITAYGYFADNEFLNMSNVFVCDVINI